MASRTVPSFSVEVYLFTQTRSERHKELLQTSVLRDRRVIRESLIGFGIKLFSFFRTFSQLTTEN